MCIMRIISQVREKRSGGKMKDLYLYRVVLAGENTVYIFKCLCYAF